MESQCRVYQYRIGVVRCVATRHRVIFLFPYHRGAYEVWRIGPVCTVDGLGKIGQPPGQFRVMHMSDSVVYGERERAR